MIQLYHKIHELEQKIDQKERGAVPAAAVTVRALRCSLPPPRSRSTLTTRVHAARLLVHVCMRRRPSPEW
jgi:hypothetical protein